LPELIEAFEPERIHKAGARFDYEKALWFNQQYVHKLSFAEAGPRLATMLEVSGHTLSSAHLEAIFHLLQPRVHRLHEILEQGYYFFQSDIRYESDEIHKKWTPEAATFLDRFAGLLHTADRFDAVTNGALLKESMAEAGLKMGPIMPLL